MRQVCFQGIGDLPGGQFSSVAYGVARANGATVVVGESHSSQSQASLNRSEPCKYANGSIHRIINAAAPNAFGVAVDVALVGTQTIVVGVANGGAMRAVQSGNELVPAQILPGPSGALAVRANSVSDDGQTVVGLYNAPVGQTGAFRWTQTSGISTALPHLPGHTGGMRINAVSPNGFLAVGSDQNTVTTPFSSINQDAYVFPRPGQLCTALNPCVPQGIGDLPGGIVASEMFGVTNSGIAVGYGTPAVGRVGFMWIPSFPGPGTQVTIGDLPGDPPGFGVQPFALATSISGDGLIVVGQGRSTLGDEAFMWRSDLGILNLREMLIADYAVTGLEGWTLRIANAVSTDGLAIAGGGRNPAGSNEGWLITLPDCNGNNRWDGLDAPIPSTRTTRSVLEFDGVDDLVELATPTAELRITGDLTLEAWVYLHRLGVTQSLITMGGAGESLPSNILYALEVDASGDLRITHERADFSDATVVADTNLHIGLWYHLAITRQALSSSTLVQYAVQVDQRDPLLLATTGSPAGGEAGRLRIGHAEGASPDRPFDGFISDVRIWNVSRTAEAIRASMFTSAPADTTGLVASWRLDEASGSLLDDAVGGNDLTVAVGGIRQTVGADCNLNRIPDSCDIDCNQNAIPDDCDVRDASSCDNDGNGRPDECDTLDILAELLSRELAATEVFRNERDNPVSPTTFGTMIQRYGRPWKPGTGQTPGGGVCAGGTRDGLVCGPGSNCPGGNCNPPVGTGPQRDPAERLRSLIEDPACLPVGVAQQVLNELSGFEMLLGNEAFADAMDPTVGEGVLGEGISLEQIPGLFAFHGLATAGSLLAEELSLLRGREITLPALADQPLNDDPPTNLNGNYPQFGEAVRAAIYNRLRPNAGSTLGSVAYRSNYGKGDDEQASEAFPQGHGDAFGYYLTAAKSYLDVFGAARSERVSAGVAQGFIESQSPTPGSAECDGVDCEAVLDDDDVTHQVAFHSVRNMAAAMAAKARTVIRIVDLTFRQDYHEDIDTRLTDTDAARAWGIGDWARRGGVGAYFDWAVLNHLLPVPEPDAEDVLEAVHRERVDEVRLLASAVSAMQERVDAAGAGLNPLGLVSNVVPFRIIQPGQLLNFLEEGSNAGKSHYGIVRDAAVEAIKNARGILKRANLALNRLSSNESSFADFEDRVRESNVGLSNRLIEIFGLPSPSDRADNDFEDNDGDGEQVTDGLNDPEDDGIEAGCNGECAGSADLASFLVDSQTLEDLGQQPRAAVGQVQLAMFELRISALRAQSAELAIANLEALIQDKAENVALTRQEAIETLQIRAQACSEQFSVIDRKKELAEAREKRGLFGRVGGLVVAAAACYYSSGAAASKCKDTKNGAASFAGQALGEKASDHFSGSPIDEQFNIEREELRINCWQTAQLTRISGDQQIRALEIELEDLIRRTPQAILELAVAETQAQQALAVVQKSFQEGKRLLDERDRIRRVQSDKLEDFRFRDMAFRTFRNQALEQYGAFFDLAARYVMLAARAFAYEYNERDEVDDQMRVLYRERLLGTESATDQGLESIIARLDQKRQESDFAARLQKLSLFDHGGDEFSLRKNLLGLAIDPSQDTNQQQLDKNKAFRAFLESNIVQELLDVPAFRQFASFDSDRDAGPALVLNIPTEVAGRTFFGQRRGTTFGAPANFDTCSNPKVFEFAILLEGVDNPGAIGVDSQLIFAHFLPVGSSMLRSPAGGDCSRRPVRTWSVVDQRIPGVSAKYRDSGGAILDSLDIPRLATSPELDIINRFPVTQAQIRNTDAPVFQDDLAGWSAWNTQWLLVIPGRQFADPNDDAAVVRRKLLILIFDADANGNPRNPNANLGIDDIKLRIKAYGKPS